MTEFITLTLKGREKIGIEGQPLWHDWHVIQGVLREIMRGKPPELLHLWLKLAGKIQEAAELVDFGHAKRITTREGLLRCQRCGNPLEIIQPEAYMVEIRTAPDFTISLTQRETKHFWEELMKLKYEQFGSNLPTGTLYHMLQDIAQQLDKEMLITDEEKEE